MPNDRDRDCPSSLPALRPPHFESSPSSAASIWRRRSVSPADARGGVAVQERLGQAHDRVGEQVGRERRSQSPRAPPLRSCAGRPRPSAAARRRCSTSARAAPARARRRAARAAPRRAASSRLKASKLSSSASAPWPPTRARSTASRSSPSSAITSPSSSSRVRNQRCIVARARPSSRAIACTSIRSPARKRARASASASSRVAAAGRPGRPPATLGRAAGIAPSLRSPRRAAFGRRWRDAGL